MSQRERILAYVTLGLVVVGLSYILLHKLLLAPARDVAKQIGGVAVDVEQLQGKVDLGPAYREKLVDAAKRSFGDDETVANQLMRAHLVRLHERSGLSAEALSMTPVTGKRVHGAKAIGWIVRTRGSLRKLTDLMFLLQSDPHLRRVDNVTWSPVTRSTDVDLQLTYSSLVLEPIPGAAELIIEPGKLAGSDSLKNDRRKQYALIAERDVFRPYIKRPPPPKPPQRPPTRRTDDRPRPRPPAKQVKLVSLSSFSGNPEVVVRELPNGEARKLEIGGDLIGGEIIAVDYRAMPHPTRPLLQSNSRAIVRIGREYWAVELGQLLSERRKLKTADLPTALRDKIEAATQAANDKAGTAPDQTPSPKQAAPPDAVAPVSPVAPDAIGDTESEPSEGQETQDAP